MGSLRVVKDEILSQGFGEQRLIMDDVQVILNELLLKGPVIALNVGIDPGAMGIDEVMGDAIFAQLLFKLSQVLRAIIALPGFDHPWIYCFEAPIEVPHVLAIEPLVVEGQGKFELGINSAQEVVLDTFCDPLHRVRENVTPIRGLRGMPDPQPLAPLAPLSGPMGAGVMVNPPGTLEEHLMPLEDIANGGGRHTAPSPLLALLIQ